MSVRDIEIGSVAVDSYREIISEALFDSLIDATSKVRGLSIYHVNATSDGGGVAEMLHSVVPLMRGLGIDARWFVLDGADAGFFDTTKKMHNLLQGKAGELSAFERSAYLNHSERFAKSLEDLAPDVWVIHDPQPLAALPMARTSSRAVRIWRSHIDTSHPNPTALEFLLPYIDSYDWTVFSLPEYSPATVPLERRLVFSPAIDPLATKNQLMSKEQADGIVRGLGLAPDRPLMVQVSRFDHWKDPIGVVDAFRRARRHVPDLQAGPGRCLQRAG